MGGLRLAAPIIEMFLVHNGKIFKKSEALVPIFDPALFADFRIYETLRIEGGQVVFLDDHINRILNSARIIGMELGHSPQTIAIWINQCIKANRTDFGIYRLIVHGDAEKNATSQVYIYPEDFRQPTAQERAQGIKVITFTGERIYPAAKTISRLTQFRATRAARQANAFEAILVGEDGQVSEGVRSNVFIVKDGELITPSLETILPGIRRRYVLELARRRGIEVEERRIGKDELHTADEIFITSTILELASVGEIDGGQLPPHRPIYDQLYKDFKKLKEQCLNEKITVS